jgi:hypothetical protein
VTATAIPRSAVQPANDSRLVVDATGPNAATGLLQGRRRGRRQDHVVGIDAVLLAEDRAEARASHARVEQAEPVGWCTGPLGSTPTSRGVRRLTACERSRRSGNTHARSSAFRCSPQQKDRLGVLPDESLNVVHSSPQKIRNFTGRGVAKTYLDDLWRMPSHQGPGKEIIVFRDDDEASRLGESPDSFIILVGEPDIAHVATAGKARQKNFHEPKRQILVEKSLHATDPRRRRSRSAAKAKQARISSLVSSGKSERISASVIPEARYSSTSETVIRKPRMQGFPLRFPGSTVIRLEKFAVMT